MWISTRKYMDLIDSHNREIRNLDREYMERSAQALADRTKEVADERKLRDKGSNEWRKTVEALINRIQGISSGKDQQMAYLIAGAGILIGLLAVVASIVIAVVT